MAEKGESQFLRCQQCRQLHGKEIREMRIPYSPLKKKPVFEGNFYWADFTSHNEGFLQERERKEEKWEFSITDQEIITLYQLLEENQVVVIVSPTGTGKSTFIPKRLIFPPQGYKGDFVERLMRQGQIIITQPRILATIRVPEGIAKISGAQIGAGHLIGFRYSGADLSDRWNRIITITDGTLPNWIREGRLGQYSLIFVDEAHERSCNIDLILGFLRRELPKYPQLRLIISSATINPQKFLEAFQEMGVSCTLMDLSYLAQKKRVKTYIHFWRDENAYILTPEGRLEKTLCDCWLCRKPKDKRKEFWKSQKEEIKESDLSETIVSLVSEILEETEKGDIVVFLHGERVINEVVERLKMKHPSVKVIPVYRRIQAEAEEELAKITDKRRVIVGTNILETSITLKGAVYGIESGLIKEARWDPDNEIFTLPTCFHTQDGRKQRWGRLGRTEIGYVYNLYTKEEFEKARPHTVPEITRSSLEDTLFNLKTTGITKVESFPWLENPDDFPQMAKEIKRSEEVLSRKGFLRKEGQILERALDLLGIPRDSTDAQFLILASREGCLFEAILTLFLMSSREKEPRTGENLYNKSLGLLIWDPAWSAFTKMRVWNLHQGLKVGCQDDLDFVIKLAFCFNRARKKGIAKEWAEYYFVNANVLEDIFNEIEELIADRFGEEREDSFREINLEKIRKVRTLLAHFWSQKLALLRPEEKVINYSTIEGRGEGVLSPFCTGDWREEEKAFILLSQEGEAIIEGVPKTLPVGSFVMKLPEKVKEIKEIDFFIDQIIPVESWVEVEENGERVHIKGIKKLPPPVNIFYQEEIISIPEEESRIEKEIHFREEFLFDLSYSGEESLPLEGIWLGERRGELARIVKWIEKNGKQIAILSAVSDEEVTKTKKEFFEVKIEKIWRDPVGKGVWVEGRDKEGHLFPIEFKELSLSLKGVGLEKIEGKTLYLKNKGVKKGKFVKLSNIEQIIEDLRKLREEIKGSVLMTQTRKVKFIEKKGYVADLDLEQEKAIVALPREGGVLHTFEIAKEYLPGGELKNLKIGEEVTLRIFLQEGKDEIPIEFFTPEEIENLPPDWEIDELVGKVLVPFCLEDKDFQEWPARKELVEFIKRHSWQFSLRAQVRKSYKAKALISWSPLQYLLAPSVYNINAIARKFIGPKGANIKNLIGSERVRVKVTGFLINVEASDPATREKICERITEWFKKELKIKLKWEYF